MACFNPISLPTKAQNGLVIGGKNVPCGKCIGCLQRRRADWSFRLRQEAKQHTLTTFLTLTYRDEDLPTVKGDPSLDKKELIRYFKRVRKEDPRLKYYAVGEYGSETDRPHYHAIVFGVKPETLANNWQQGHVSCDTVTDASIHYVTKYVINQMPYSENVLKPFAIMSKGLGKIYLKNAEKFHKSNFTTTTRVEGGRKILIPRYYRDRIFNEREKRKLSKISREQANEKVRNTPWERIYNEKEAKTLIVKNNSKSKKV